MTSSNPAGNIGLKQDLQFKQGADFATEFDLFNQDDTPFDLTPYTHVAHLRKKPFATPVVSIAATSPSVGRLRFGLTHVETAAITCGADIDSEASSYVWDHELITIADGVIVPGFYGDVSVLRDI